MRQLGFGLGSGGAAPAAAPSEPANGYSTWFDYTDPANGYSDDAGLTPIANTDDVAVALWKPSGSPEVAGNIVSPTAGGYDRSTWRKEAGSTGKGALTVDTHGGATPYPRFQLQNLGAYIGGEGSADYTLVAVIEQLGAGSWSRDFPEGWGGIAFDGDGGWVRLSMSGYDSDYPTSGAWSAGHYAAASTLALNAPHILTWVRSGATLRVFADGHEYASNIGNPSALGISAAMATSSMQASYGGGRPLPIPVLFHEDILYPLAISNGMLTQTHGYLAAKYGITLLP